MSTKLDQAAHDAAVLPRIRDLVADHQSLRQIADQLEADGFPSPSGQSQWSYVAVKRILDRAGTPAPESNPPTPPAADDNRYWSGDCTRPDGCGRWGSDY